MEHFVASCREYGRTQRSLAAVVDALVSMQRHRAQLVTALRTEEQWASDCSASTGSGRGDGDRKGRTLHLTSPLGVLGFFQTPTTANSAGRQSVVLPAVQGQLSSLEEDVSILISQYSNLVHTLTDIPRKIGLHCTQPLQDALLATTGGSSNSHTQTINNNKKAPHQQSPEETLSSLMSLSKDQLPIPYDPLMILAMMEEVQARVSQHAAICDASVLPLRSALAEALGGGDDTRQQDVSGLDGSALTELRQVVLLPLMRAQESRRRQTSQIHDTKATALEVPQATGLMSILEALSIGVKDETVVMPPEGSQGGATDDLLKLFLL